MAEFITVRELFDSVRTGDLIELESYDYVQIEGWVRTNRDNGSLGFLEINDGTFFKSCQVIYEASEMNDYDSIRKISTGSAISVIGKLIITPNAKQPFEIKATEVSVTQMCPEDYPLQKKRHSFEYLREIAHLRPRTNTFMAVMRIRSVASMAIHEFFQSQGFVYVHAPIITGNDAEGAGEAFTVTTRSDGKYDEDFFGKKAALTVSGQLNAEAYALAFRDVYTFGPTFRAENSHTSRHAAEFWMIEPEIAFADLEDCMDLIEDMTKFCIQYVLDNAAEEMVFLDSFIEKGLIAKLQKVVNSEFVRMTYTQAIEYLLAADVKFEFPVSWGMDIASEHERYICEKIIDGPVFLCDYPKDIKAFYMRTNEDNKTVAACDLLVPGIGELVGGSQREERYDYLVKRMAEMNIPQEGLEWYLDLRRFGGVEHAGYGLGFERFLMYITGISNIRDVIPFPRTPRNLLY